MNPLSILELKQAVQATDGRVEARVHAQAETVAEKQTRDGKPYWEITLADAESKLVLRAWSDSPMFDFCAQLAPGAFLEVEGEFSVHPAFGLEARQWNARPLDDKAVEELLGGPPALREKQERDWETVREKLGSLADPRLHALCDALLTDFEPRFRRAAAARTYHHARRGGLVEHVAQMLRAADAIAGVYSELNRDLLLAGVFLHDIGKLWESCPEPRGFGMPYDERGELMGHITLGIETLNAVWRRIFPEPEPGNEDVRNHLIHLIAAHHGELEFGSPIPPKTPEAFVLHYLDNLDAKMEMLHAAYQTGTALAPRVIERVRPLPGNLVKPLGTQ